MHIRKFEKSRFKYLPSFMNELGSYKNGVYLIKGPRQIGKTTILKLIIRNLIKKILTPQIFSILHLI